MVTWKATSLAAWQRPFQHCSSGLHEEKNEGEREKGRKNQKKKKEAKEAKELIGGCRRRRQPEEAASWWSATAAWLSPSEPENGGERVRSKEQHTELGSNKKKGHREETHTRQQSKRSSRQERAKTDSKKEQEEKAPVRRETFVHHGHHLAPSSSTSPPDLPSPWPTFTVAILPPRRAPSTVNPRSSSSPSHHCSHCQWRSRAHCHRRGQNGSLRQLFHPEQLNRSTSCRPLCSCHPGRLPRRLLHHRPLLQQSPPSAQVITETPSTSNRGCISSHSSPPRCAPASLPSPELRGRINLRNSSPPHTRYHRGSLAAPEFPQCQNPPARSMSLQRRSPRHHHLSATVCCTCPRLAATTPPPKPRSTLTVAIFILSSSSPLTASGQPVLSLSLHLCRARRPRPAHRRSEPDAIPSVDISPASQICDARLHPRILRE